MKSDNYVPLGNTTVPLTPLLLIFAGLGAAAVGLVIALLRIFVPSCMSRSSRIVLEERERARQDLRVRGAISPRGSPGGSPSPGSSSPTLAHSKRFPPNKPLRPVGRNSRGSSTLGGSTPGESSTSSLASKRPQHGYRGTSFSLTEAQKYTAKSYRSSASGLRSPLLRSNDSSSGSSTLHGNGARDSAMSERAKTPLFSNNEPPLLRNAPVHRLSFGPRPLSRTSSTGKGADLQRTRSGRQAPEIALHPSAVDPAYPQHKWGRQESSSRHPLQSAATRRDSTLSGYEVSSSSAEHSYLESNATSRIGSFSMPGNPLQPLSAAGLGGGQPWASPRTGSSEFVPDTARLGVAAPSRNSSASGLLDSDGSDHGAAPVLVPSRATSKLSFRGGEAF
ncbi:hypothetical protein PSEUBRA_000720 [Kalmanozyma brasiliensis GHG001]|uniref:Uncharacterized protein n=1 Tax=Kalmanozyma brasiliensis (strain GHG001) TaxID=1365824 RepID=V5EG23_KALBG|nr:uncharacterized protein PSEUBRA_000720 [Kalmanozyma brasiliensis GHG001]EST09506.1 hypothetical protein PSEUBRA_000720 [Kalmanozyma brasiliensis GHG001]